MKSATTVLLGLVVTVTVPSYAEVPAGKNQEIPILASELDWKGGMAGHGANEQRIFVLSAGGFLSLPFLGGSPEECDDLDERVTNWIKAHPNATVVPIQETKLSDDVTFVYSWVVDGGENLNTHLARIGCLPARRLEIQDRQGLLVPAEEFAKFVKSIHQAEADAIKEKAGNWGKPRADGPAHWTTAVRLEKEGKVQEAIAEFRRAIDAGHETDSAWFRIGKCLERLNDLEGAVKAFDESVRTSEGQQEARSAKIERAICIGKLRGTQAASESMGGDPSDCKTSLEQCLDLATVHAGIGKFAEAVQVLEKGVQSLVDHCEIKFDGSNFQLDRPRAKRSDQYWKAVNELSWGLPTLASYALQAENFNAATGYAEQGISVRRAIFEHVADAFGQPRDPAVIEAGDYRARMVLAVAYQKQGKFEDAKREIDHAKVLVDVGVIQGGGVREELNRAYQELQKAFPGRPLEVPGEHKRLAKEKHKELTPQAAASMSEDALIAAAAAEDPGSAFAACEELVGRYLEGKLSPGGLTQLIHEGLNRQADTGRRWLAQYGVFIEGEHALGRLAAADYLRYAKGAAAVHDFEVNFNHKFLRPGEKAYVSIRGFVEPRVGGSLRIKRDGTEKSMFTVVATLTDFTIDGASYSKFVNPDEQERRQVVSLNAGMMTGFGTRLADSDKLAVGGHTLIANGTFSIYEGDLGRRSWDVDWETVKPLVEVPISAKAEFEVEKE